MYGMDISSYQNGIDLSKGKYDFAIIKATEGIGMVDKKFVEFQSKLKSLNKLIGCYHFARPDLHPTIMAMKDEANFFLDTLDNYDLIGKAILVLDWETEPMDRPDLIEAWVTVIQKWTYAIPFIYGSRSKLSKWMKYDIVSSFPIWCAAWPSIKRLPVGEDPGYATEPRTIPWIIWQYSSTGQYPGFSGNVDLDFADMSKETWMKYANNKPAPMKENINADMKWAIINGLYIGAEDGLYHPQDPLTRDGAATLLRRFKEKFID